MGQLARRGCLEVDGLGGRRYAKGDLCAEKTIQCLDFEGSYVNQHVIK